MPVLHSEAELGSLAPAVELASIALCGQERWATHKETVLKLWQAIEDYLSSLKATNLKVYLDGLPVDGELGGRLVQEAAARGSRGHQIVWLLMDGGAELRRTEDVSLLQEERDHLLRLTQEKPATKKAHTDYPSQKRQLTKERDRFIAHRINQTLKEGETAVLFIGAYHQVLPLLVLDIIVEKVKEPEKVMAYFQELFSGRDEAKLAGLASYLTAPILTTCGII